MNRRDFIKSIAICAGAGAFGLPAMGREAAYINPRLPFVEEQWLGVGRIINHSDEMILLEHYMDNGGLHWLGWLGGQTNIELNVFSEAIIPNGVTKAYVIRNGERIEVPIYNSWPTGTQVITSLN